MSGPRSIAPLSIRHQVLIANSTQIPSVAFSQLGNVFSSCSFGPDVDVAQIQAFEVQLSTELHNTELPVWLNHPKAVSTIQHNIRMTMPLLEEITDVVEAQEEIARVLFANTVTLEFVPSAKGSKSTLFISRNKARAEKKNTVNAIKSLAAHKKQLAQKSAAPAPAKPQPSPEEISRQTEVEAQTRHRLFSNQCVRFTAHLSDGKPQYYMLKPGESITVGRIGNDIQTPSALNGISRSHLRISNIDGNIVVEDLNSANGTFIDDKKITSQPLTEETNTLMLANDIPLHITVFPSIGVTGQEIGSGYTGVTASIEVFNEEGQLIHNVEATLDPGEELIFGRNSKHGNVDIPINEQHISRTHCKLVNKAGNLFILDTSRYGGVLIPVDGKRKRERGKEKKGIEKRKIDAELLIKDLYPNTFYIEDNKIEIFVMGRKLPSDKHLSKRITSAIQSDQAVSQPVQPKAQDEDPKYKDPAPVPLKRRPGPAKRLWDAIIGRLSSKKKKDPVQPHVLAGKQEQPQAAAAEQPSQPGSSDAETLTEDGPIDLPMDSLISPDAARQAQKAADETGSPQAVSTAMPDIAAEETLIHSNEDVHQILNAKREYYTKLFFAFKDFNMKHTRDYKETSYPIDNQYYLDLYVRGLEDESKESIPKDEIYYTQEEIDMIVLAAIRDDAKTIIEEMKKSQSIIKPDFNPERDLNYQEALAALDNARKDYFELFAALNAFNQAHVQGFVLQPPLSPSDEKITAEDGDGMFFNADIPHIFDATRKEDIRSISSLISIARKHILAAIKEYDRGIYELMAENRRLKDLLDKAEQLNRQNGGLRITINSLRDQIKALQAAQQKHQEELQQLREENERLTRTIAEKDVDIQQATLSLSQEIARKEKEIAQRDRQIEILTRTIQSLAALKQTDNDGGDGANGGSGIGI